MLDAETKSRIDSARQMLVGKVPDPKSQVEQITIAMIYKFMDDMDAEAVEFGGKRTFFAGDYAKYGWSKLLKTGLPGHEMLTLYSDAIGSMTQNPGLPPLFRDIFKNAYLPYRDPETLRAFLKIINEFHYDHSERLGDAFEYLLSVLGSQGDAGQFRTPRHIIDFMVEIMKPQKNEVVMDPACGTAGFLISAYKYILRNNTDRNSNSTLTPDQKAKLVDNFKGYDISPDMVRLSLVNLYLHGFTDPHVCEYDTLTSEERWNEFADVILANPPFMSPKGGIKPHKRFSIQAKRSEVLFVDYIAEHLTPNGRAAIIVPEGIILTNQAAYKELRKLLVENSLVAVISLPAGCFNPYSPVKTSILILDKSIAKASENIAFFKVENDGFGLGAQRRAVEKNDLPQVQTELARYLDAVRKSEDITALELPCGLIVPKAKLSANGDYNLSGEKYREGAAKSKLFAWRKVESLVETITPPAKIQKTAFGQSGRFPIIDQSQDYIAGWTDDEDVLVHPRKPLVIFGDHTCAIKLIESPFAQGADGIKILQTNDELDPRYLFHVLLAKPLESDGYQRHYSKLKEHQIPLPPLDLQREIVTEIEDYQKVINGARAVLDNYRPRIPIQPDWPMGVLADVCTLISGQHIDQVDYNTNRVGMDYLTGPSDFGFKHPVATRWTSKPKVFAEKGDILMTVKGSGLGSINFLDTERAAISRQLMAIRVRNAEPEFIYVLLMAMFDHIQSLGGGAAIPGIKREDVLGLKIPIPPLATQQDIVTEILAEQALAAANKDLIERMEKKIQGVLARVWGECI